MKLACSVEVVRHCVDLKARLALKTDLSVFNDNLALRSKQGARSKKQEGRRPKANAENACQQQSKKQETNVNIKMLVMIGH